MDELPNEIMPIVAGYLPPLDAIQLNNTCKKLHSKLSFTVTSPRQILIKFVRHDRDDDAHYGFQIPVPNQVTCHSMLLSMRCRDQGWGKRTGRVFVLAEEKTNFHGRSGQRFGGGRIVHASGIVPREERRLDITFRPRKNETYHLWYAVGEDHGQSIRLSNVRIQALMFDDPLKCFGKACNFLTRTDTLHAWDMESRANVHVDVEEFVMTRGENLLPPIISFAGGHEVSGENLQRKLRKFVKSLRFSWIGEFHAYAKIKSRAPSQPGPEWHVRPLETMQVDDFLEDRMDFGEYVVPENA